MLIAIITLACMVAYLMSIIAVYKMRKRKLRSLFLAKRDDILADIVSRMILSIKSGDMEQAKRENILFKYALELKFGD